ncbi:MAG: hypothetical protein K8R56_08030, partial [Candidatus Eisenbacteria bacterium]|nr:hypothetical protein [Candidatus Eisenbacteria bacterium]
YLAVVSKMGPARAMAVATAISQAAATVLWAVLLLLSVQLTPDVAGEHEVAHTVVSVWHRVGAAVVAPLLLLAVALEALLGYGLAGFLARVRPELLPVPGRSSREPAPDRTN